MSPNSQSEISRTARQLSIPQESDASTKTISKGQIPSFHISDSSSFFAKVDNFVSKNYQQSDVLDTSPTHYKKHSKTKDVPASIQEQVRNNSKAHQRGSSITFDCDSTVSPSNKQTVNSESSKLLQSPVLKTKKRLSIKDTVEVTRLESVYLNKK